MDCDKTHTSRNQGYRVWTFPVSTSLARLDAKLTSFRGKSLSQPALFSLPRIDCFLAVGVTRARFSARFSGPLSFLLRRLSSPMVTSRAHWREFSTARCARTVLRNRTGSSLSLKRKTRVSVLRSPLDFPCGCDLPDGLQAGPVMQVHQRVDVVADGRLTGLVPLVTHVHVIETEHLFRVLRLRHVEPDIVVKRLLTSPGCP